MKHLFRAVIAFEVAITLIATARPAFANHSFTVTRGTFCKNGIGFIGQPTLSDSLNLLMTAQVGDAGGNTIANGNSHTFSQVGESFDFMISFAVGTFNVGDTISYAATDEPADVINNGEEGWDGTATIEDCMLTFGTTIPLNKDGTRFEQKYVACTMTVFDAPNGNPVTGAVVKEGQVFYMGKDLVTVGDKSWTPVFVSSPQLVWIWTSCTR